MKTFWICFGIIWCISMMYLYIKIKQAPDGYEDDEGFHFSKKEDKK